MVVLPPLFYTDVEPEISSITSPPPAINSVLSIFVEEQLAFDKAVAKRKLAGKSVLLDASKQKFLKSDQVIRKREQASEELELNTSTSYSPMPRQKPDFHKPHKALWLQRYSELREFRSQNGHCMLPQSYAPNPKLGLWVMHQRRQYTLKKRGKKNSFDGPDGMRRLHLLEDIGFVWRVERGCPRRSYGSIKQSIYHAEDDTAFKDEIIDAVNFEKFLIGKSIEYSDEDVRAAWRRRFELFK